MPVPDVLAFGDLGVDAFASVEAFPAADEKLWIEPVDQPGGMMGNVAVAVVSLGVPAGVVALLGQDLRGDLVLDDLRARGVDTRFVRRIDAPTFWTLALTNPAGERCLIQFPTPAFSADWDGYDRDAADGARWIHTTAEQGEPVASLFRRARSAGVTTSLDVEHPYVLREDLEELLGLSDVVFFNRMAADALGGPDVSMRRAVDAGAGTALVTLGADGCALLDRERATHHLRAHQVEPVDTNGAGDTFGGAFIAGRLRGLVDRDAAELATIAAAISTTAVGGHGVDDLGGRVRSAAEELGVSWGSALW